MGKLCIIFHYNLKCCEALFWDDSPYTNYDFQGSGEQGLVVIIYPDVWYSTSTLGSWNSQILEKPRMSFW